MHVVERVIIIGIDGGTWDVIKPILHELPNLKKIVEGGCHGNLMSTFPPLTAPAWTAAFTGVNPGKNGAYDFFRYENFRRTPISSRDIKYPYIWDTLSKRDMKTIAISIPLTFPAKDINGVLVTGFGSPGAVDGFATPKEMQKKILEKFPNYSIDPPHTFDGDAQVYKREILEIGRQNAELTKMLLSEYPDWQLLVTVFSSTDWMQHYFWDDSESILEAYRIVDNFIGWAMENLLDDGTRFLLMSDHGFEKKGRVIYINKFLEENGYLKTRKSSSKSLFARFGGMRSSLRNLDIFKLRRFIPFSIKEKLPLKKTDTVDYDFDNSKAWMPSTSGGGLFVRDKSVLPELISKLESLQDPETGTRPIKRVHKGSEIYWGPHSKQCLDLILEPARGYEIVENYNTSWIGSKSSKDRCADHNMKGLFAAYGKDISNTGANLMIWDIAAMTLHMLGLPLYDDMDGEVSLQTFSEGSRLKSGPKKMKNLKSMRARLSGARSKKS